MSKRCAARRTESPDRPEVLSPLQTPRDATSEAPCQFDHIILHQERLIPVIKLASLWNILRAPEPEGRLAAVVIEACAIGLCAEGDPGIQPVPPDTENPLSIIVECPNWHSLKGVAALEGRILILFKENEPVLEDGELDSRVA
jgi:hypothetical protein